MLRCCGDEGLIGGEGFAVDVGVVKADGSQRQIRDYNDDFNNEIFSRIDPGSRSIARVELS